MGYGTDSDESHGARLVILKDLRCDLNLFGLLRLEGGWLDFSDVLSGF